MKVLFVPVTVNFSQEIFLDSDFRPRSYKLKARGPLGFGNRRVSVSVNDNEARVMAGDEARTLAMPSGKAFFVGTLAAYAILPALYAAWGGRNGFVLVLAGTNGGSGAPSAAGDYLAGIRFDGNRAGPARSRPVQDPGGKLHTFLPGRLESVAFLGDDERAFTAYRTHLFPNRVRLLC